MDYGTYNCRDYYVTPHPSAPIISTDLLTTPERPSHPHPAYHRHESWEELEHRSRSPASFKPKFPLLRLPLELRQEILSYILPRTKELVDSNPLTAHAREFSAVQKRMKKGMLVPSAETEAARQLRQSSSTSNVVWLRGQMSILSVCSQLHDECAELVYGRNTFLLFLTYPGIKWRYRFVLPTGMAPSRNYDFLDLVPERYRRLVKRVVVNIDHLDPYTGMIKFNVGGKGLVFGLRRQVQRLVNALKPDVVVSDGSDESDDGEEDWAFEKSRPRHLTSLSIRISNSNAVSDALDRRKNAGEVKVADDLDIMLEPLRQLYGVRTATLTGAVTFDLARDLEAAMMSEVGTVPLTSSSSSDDAGDLASPPEGLCVYGNDME
ncbi:hypothetical protein LTR78_006568 [Recurvomyces mirabilis]|uniref:Uncharacterized protein n=1 Tax=Recurvomyces mirabilis TaxID=574656 RepID=A0AAE0WL19_9PEZI|nr:hypothetical protein LTR78_006568 [Recurvomyces mirabilis]KAK5151015.1 hypothetical protein LTS14_009510 [Recurvomyces mirabilis]